MQTESFVQRAKSRESGLPALRLRKVWKLNEVLNMLVTASCRPGQAPAGNSRVFLVIL